MHVVLIYYIVIQGFSMLYSGILISESLLGFVKVYQNLIIGLGLPLVIFLIQLWLRQKDNKTCAITFIENRNYVLDPSLSNRVDGLSILYKENPIKGHLLYYQLTITNSGAKDISNSEVSTPLTISLPDNICIKSCEVYDKSEYLDLKIHVKTNEIVIEWNLFKKEEYIRLDIVADYSPSEEYMYDKQSLLSKITYNKSRIQDLKVQKANIHQYEYFLRNLKTMVFFLLSVVFLSMILNQTETVKEFSYISDNEERHSQLVFETDSVLVAGKDNLEYPILISGVQEIEVKRTNSQLKLFAFVLFNIWGFVLLEQWRMRRKRIRYGLISDKPWNQFDLEDC